MPGPNFVLDKSFKAMSVATQFRAVKLVTSVKEQVTAVTAATDPVAGFIQDNIAAARAGFQVANVRILGITEAEAGGVIAIGDKCIVDALGRVVTVGAAAAGTQIVGVALSASAALGDWFDLQLTPYNKV